MHSTEPLQNNGWKNQSAEGATELRFVFLSYLRHYFLEFKNLRILEPQKWQLKSTDNGQQSTVRVYAVAELVEAPRVVPSTGSGTVHKVCCLLSVDITSEFLKFFT